MKMEGYNIENLSIYITNKGYRRFDDLRDKESAAKAVELITKAVESETLERLDAFYGDMEAYYISIYMEKSCFALVIHDEIKGMSYNYKNLKYKDDKTEVALAGYYFPKMITCEDKETLMDIIIYFFETGSINEKYEWYREKD